jgi:hypothetical protein
LENCHERKICTHSRKPHTQVVDLKEVYKVSKNDEVLIYKEIHLGSLSLQMQPKEGAKHVPVIESMPVRVRLKQKKAFFGGPMLFYQIEAQLPEELKLSLHQVMYKQLQDVIDAVLECLYRNPTTPDAPAPTAVAAPATSVTTATPAATPAVSTATPTTDAVASTPIGSPDPTPQRSYWGRFTSVRIASNSI